MDEDTTTDVPVDTGADEAQPVEAEETTAAPQTDEPQEQAETTSEPSEDDQLAEWAKNKGLELDSDNATKAAKMAREAERAMHDKAQRASELERTLSTTSDEYAEAEAEATGQDPELLKRLQRVEVRDAVRDFWDSNPGAKEYEAQMIDELKVRPHLAGDLEALYAVVSSRDGGALKNQAKREALTSLAQKQQAAVPVGNAVNPVDTGTRITPENVDQLVSQNDDAWYHAHRDEILAATYSHPA